MRNKEDPRSEVADAVIRAFREDFIVHGKSAIERLRVESPGEYLRLCWQLRPREAGRREAGNVFLSVWRDIGNSDVGRSAKAVPASRPAAVEAALPVEGTAVELPED